MIVTELGIAIEVRPVQPQKAPIPIASILLGMTVLMQPVFSVLVAVTMIALQLSRES